MIYSYIILCLTICLFCYLFFIYNNGNRWRLIAVVAAMVGMIASIGRILEGYFPSSKLLIQNIFVTFVFILIVIFFYLAIALAWKMREDPSRKTMINISFGILIFTVISAIVVFVLAKFGFYYQ